jgi:hypothetical protein
MEAVAFILVNLSNEFGWRTPVVSPELMELSSGGIRVSYGDMTLVKAHKFMRQGA